MQRVESGRLGGRRLLRLPKGVPGLRPTSARVRGAIFDRIGDEIRGARVLDLFGGSGAMSVEAISRGASSATVVELHGQVARHLVAQAKALAIEREFEVVKSDAVQFLERRSGSSAGSFEVVIIDPPFAIPEIVDRVVAALEPCLAPDALIICELELVRGKSREVAWPASFERETTKHYGQAVVDFFRFRPVPEEPPLP